MNQWGKSVSILAALTLLFILFWPGKQSPSKDGKTHLTYWFITGQKEELPYPVAKFNAAQDTVVVEAIAIPWQESEKKILTAILSGNPPDIIDQFVPVVKWASRMALIPLDDFIAKDRFDSTAFFNALWDEMRWQGKIFGLPTATASFALYYNKRLLREAGFEEDKPPQTWGDVKEMNKRLTKFSEKGNLIQTGYIFHLGKNIKAAQQAEDSPQLMAWQLGVPFLNSAGDQFTLADQHMVSVIDWIIEAQKDIPLSELNAFMAGFGYGDQQAFIAGKTAMMIMGSNFVDNIRRYNPDMEYGIARIPTFPGKPTASTAGSWWLGIPRNAKHKKAAWDFIRFSVQKEMQIETLQHMDETLYPSNRFAAEDPRLLRTDADRIFLEMMENSHSPAVVPMAHDVFWREFYGAIERAVYGLQSTEEALEQAERIVQAELNGAIEYDRYVRAKMKFEEIAE